jgi:hypothetical protein
MPKPPKAVRTGEARVRGQHSAGNLRLYEILYNLNQGFEQDLDQLHQLEKLGLGHQPWKALRVSVEESRAESASNSLSGSPSAKKGTGNPSAGLATSGRKSFEIHKMC